jgi:endogenous inhibitor of DNA gyrase (YacG/DUF329 family)
LSPTSTIRSNVGCSLTCRLIDLGVWLDERYRIPEARQEDDVS